MQRDFRLIAVLLSVGVFTIALAACGPAVTDGKGLTGAGPDGKPGNKAYAGAALQLRSRYSGNCTYSYRTRTGQTQACQVIVNINQTSNEIGFAISGSIDNKPTSFSTGAYTISGNDLVDQVGNRVGMIGEQAVVLNGAGYQSVTLQLNTDSSLNLWIGTMPDFETSAFAALDSIATPSSSLMATLR